MRGIGPTTRVIANGLRIGVLALAGGTVAAAPPASTPVAPTATRTVYRCTANGTVSLATAPEPGSRCKPITFDANAAKLPDLWQLSGAQRGVLYEYTRDDGSTYLSTRKRDGGERVLAFSVPAPPGSPAHRGLADPGPPRWDLMRSEFAAAARVSGVDEAWLRAIAHVESGYRSDALSPKGAQGVMQLMPEIVAAFEVSDPYDPNQSIQAGALHLRDLIRRYPHDLPRVAAAYNAGSGAVDQYDGVPPFAETQAYVETVVALHRKYRDAAR
jgi:hypothetical protein